MLSDEEISVEGLKFLYRKLLQRVESMIETARLESLGEAYASCRKDFEALSHDGLSDLEQALTRLEHLVADVERRVIMLHNVRTRHEGAGVMSPAGVHQPAGASSAQLDRFSSTVEAVDRVDQERESASVGAGGTIVPAPFDVQGVQRARRRGEVGYRCTFKAIRGHARAPSPRINPAAMSQSLHMAAVEGRSQARYYREHPPHSQLYASPNFPPSTRLPLPAPNPS